MDKGAEIRLEPSPLHTQTIITSVAERRIQRRIDVFTEWIEFKRIPPEFVIDLPSTLTQLREWEVTSLGITSSTSPNDYVRNHPTWGEKVVKAELLMKEVQALLVAPKPKESATNRTIRHQAKLREQSHLLKLAADQWHALAEGLVEAKRDCRYHQDISSALKAQLAACEAKLQERDSQLAEARRDLHVLQGVPRILKK